MVNSCITHIKNVIPTINVITINHKCNNLCSAPKENLIILCHFGTSSAFLLQNRFSHFWFSRQASGPVFFLKSNLLLGSHIAYRGPSFSLSCDCGIIVSGLFCRLNAIPLVLPDKHGALSLWRIDETKYRKSPIKRWHYLSSSLVQRYWSLDKSRHLSGS